MNTTTNFSNLANLVTVTDIVSPILEYYEGSTLVDEEIERWEIDLCMERDLNPMDQLALVTSNGKVVGWIGYDMLEPGMTFLECMEPIAADGILSSDTSLLDTVEAYGNTKHWVFLINRGNHFVGWISYYSLHKAPFRLCLFALVLNIERILLNILLHKPSNAWRLISEKRQENARKVYFLRNNAQTDEPHPANLLECTCMSDKFKMAIKSPDIYNAVPSLANKKYCRIIEDLRNDIAHPRLSEQSSKLLERDNLWPYIKWCAELEGQLQKYADTLNAPFTSPR